MPRWLARTPAVQVAVLLSLLAALLTLCWIGGRPFSTRGEPREALVIQGMLATGDWVSPPAYGGAVPSKPPFMHWLAASASLVGGEVTEFTARLPSALAFTLFLPWYYLFVARRRGQDEALLASIILATSIEWFRAATTCRVDMTLAVSLAAALLLLLDWYERGSRGWPVLAGVSLSAAMLSKGPVGLVLPAGIFGAYLLLRGETFARSTRLVLFLTLPATLPYLGWFFLAATGRGDSFLAKMYYENIARFTSTMDDEPHKKGVLYLYGTLLLGFLPWTVLLVSWAVRWFRPKATGMRGLKASAVAWWRRQPPLIQFSLLACGVVLLFFSIPSSKRSVYLLPLYPTLAILTAALIRARWSEFGILAVRLVQGAGVLVMVLMLLLMALQAGALPLSLVVRNPSTLSDVVLLLAALGSAWSESALLEKAMLFLPLLCAGGALLPWGRPARTVQWGIPLLFSLLLISHAFLLSALSGALTERSFAEAIREKVRGKTLYSYGNEFYGTSFYLQQRISSVVSQEFQRGDAVILFPRNLEKLGEEALKRGLMLKELYTHDGSVINPGDRPMLVSVVPSRGSAGQESGLE